MKGTIHLGLVFTTTANGNNESPNLVGFSDSDWAGDPITRRSVSGYIFTHAGAAVSWRSHQQHSTALSSAEAELMAMTTAVQEAMWLRKVLRSMGYQTTNLPLLMRTTKAADDIKRTSHQQEQAYRCKYFYVREQV